MDIYEQIDKRVAELRDEKLAQLKAEKELEAAKLKAVQDKLNEFKDWMNEAGIPQDCLREWTPPNEGCPMIVKLNISGVELKFYSCWIFRHLDPSFERFPSCIPPTALWGTSIPQEEVYFYSPDDFATFISDQVAQALIKASR